MMTGSLMAGLAFSNASLGLVHAMAHSLGGALGLPHGECNALLLESVVAFNYDHASPKYDVLAREMGLDIDTKAPEQRGNALAQAITDLRRTLDINLRLKDLGVRQSGLKTLAQFASNDPCLATNPKAASPDQIENLYLEGF